MHTSPIPPSRPPGQAPPMGGLAYAAPAPAPTVLPFDAVFLGPVPAAFRPDAAPLPPAPPVVRVAAHSAVASVPQTLFEDTEAATPSLRDQLEALNPGLMQVPPQAAALPASLPRVQPTEGMRFLPDKPAFFMNLPGIGPAVARLESGDGRANTHCDALAAAFDLHLPCVDRAPERLVPRTGVAWVEQPFSTRVKDGRPGPDAPCGLYSFQAYIDGASEYKDAKTGFHPQYVRMAWLDALGDNWNRNTSSWLVTPDGAPHCHQNGSLFHKMGGFVEDMGYGWSLAQAKVITPQNERHFLHLSRDYAFKAQAALTDSVIDDEISRLRHVPSYGSVDFDALGARVRDLRDKIPHLIEARLRKH